MNHQFLTYDTPDTVPWWDHPDRRCAGTPPAMWFPPENSGAEGEHMDAPRARCMDCPFLVDCATDAVTRGDRYGIRAGVLLSTLRGRKQLAEMVAEWQEITERLSVIA